MKKINPLILLVPLATIIVLILLVLKWCGKTRVKYWSYTKITSPLWVLLGLEMFKRYWRFEDE